MIISVIPANAGISGQEVSAACAEIPAFAGMTNLGRLAADLALEMPS